MSIVFFPNLEISLFGSVLVYLSVAQFDIFIIIIGIVMIIIDVVGVYLTHTHVFFVVIVMFDISVLANVVNKLIAHEIIVISLHITSHGVES